jgi:hypothetical protein
MKRIAFALIAVIAISTFASAEVLTTAKTIGEGNMAVQGFYTSNSLAGDSASQFGPKIFYGVTKDIDIIGKLGMGSYGGVSASTLGVGGKMNFVKAEAKTGLDIGGYANYETVSITGVTLSTMGVGGIFSKEVKKDITLYGILGFTMLSYKVSGFPSVSSTALTFGGGIDFKVSKDLNLLAELTTFSADGGSYSTFALGGTYALR